MLANANGDHDSRGCGVRALGARWVTSVLAAVCSLALLLTGFAVLLPASTAYAADGQGSITVNYQDDDAPIVGAQAHLYHVADWNGNNDGFTPTSQFKKYSVDWNISGADSETFRQLAETLAGYISRDTLKSQADQTTDSTGTAVFKDLSRGLYLVTVDAYDGDSLSCKASSTLVVLPSDSGSLDVTLQPKTECSPRETPPPPTEEKVKKKVTKVWKNDTEANRPSKVIVQLLQDGKVFNEAELNAANGWSYEWSDLPADHEYRIVEKTVAEHYTVLVDRESDETIITNTYNPPPNPPKKKTPPPSTPPSRTPPAETGSNVTTAAACAVGLSGAGLAVLRVRRRHKASNN
ncbi:Cna B-type domain-containing protein [Bifidobacterium amazonense]|uniref:Cna B-type domain-containing protein n=1 Tax=Bifidobacterium amazonense TaxID=2809027 RepID=A0ABS9VYS6_9BIFI|nr:Cna B-type domain-containing protein [Bifidobacterium amazonense]MCH9277270.1 Cna B-type domain-containing protein [Bifidobacterium amazonense]